MTQRPKVVVTGIGPVTPIGIGISSFWEGLTTGRNGVRSITAFDTSALPVKVAGEVPGWDPTAFLDAKEARRTDPFAQYALGAAQLAWDDAGNPEVPSERGGVIFATGIGGIQTLLNQHVVMLEKGAGRVSPDWTSECLLRRSRSASGPSRPTASERVVSPKSSGNIAVGCREPEHGSVPGVNTATVGRSSPRRT